MCDLFNDITHELEKYYGFICVSKEAEASYNFLKRVKMLPKEARTIL